MAYATGKFAYGLCDYCGQRYRLNVLQKNWRGFKVCPEDYEPKEPQLDPLRYNGDAIALFEPRPDRVEPMDVYVGAPGDSAFASVGFVNGTNNMRPDRESPALIGKTFVGKVEVITT